MRAPVVLVAVASVLSVCGIGASGLAASTLETTFTYHALLLDMKYYFTDPENWFAEKEKIHIDGA